MTARTPGRTPGGDRDGLPTLFEELLGGYGEGSEIDYGYRTSIGPAPRRPRRQQRST